MSRQASLDVHQTLKLPDDLDMEGDWSNSEDEDGGDNSHLPNVLEITQNLTITNLSQSQAFSHVRMYNVASLWLIIGPFLRISPLDWIQRKQH